MSGNPGAPAVHEQDSSRAVAHRSIKDSRGVNGLNCSRLICSSFWRFGIRYIPNTGCAMSKSFRNAAGPSTCKIHAHFDWAREFVSDDRIANEPAFLTLSPEELRCVTCWGGIRCSHL